MFGYIRPYQPELKMREYEQYRGLYCSLCRCLGKRHGCLAQMTLSYDMTFLLLLHLALAEDCTGFHKARCPYNPLKKRLCCGTGPALDRCADSSVLLVYYKAHDAVNDSRGVKRAAAWVALAAARRSHRRAAENEPALDAAMADYMQAQSLREAKKTASVDAAAEPTAVLLSHLCALPAANEKQQQVLARFGYCLGRWIYLMDAADDLVEDSQSGNYNPFLVGLGRRPFAEEQLQVCREKARGSLNASLAACKAAYELLDVRRFDGILRNILEWGMPQVQQQVLAGTFHAKSGRFKK